MLEGELDVDVEEALEGDDELGVALGDAAGAGAHGEGLHCAGDLVDPVSAI